ncbi:MAG TPA: UDP-N-acetylmuramoyl-tripeptide--D-alanyl-D-alanine ligase [Clostridiales bacterium]|jgi:UDP-N-acetylmuramoyl-tripeptide--D-alanyl-D-alanine ligase|nr:UDP-N-acetylmuramoyl-tripeptide--D-alanyl-D-alanine ligase [Clostridiales bacterium]
MKIRLGAGKLNMSEASGFTGGFLVGGGNAEFDSICTDSREAGPGVLFVALRGERTDGYDYIPQAAKVGCRCVVAERIDSSLPGEITALIVPDSQRALLDIARGYRERVSCRRVGITGSVGKTTTKEYISAVLAERYMTHKTAGNYNSLIGMPLTLVETPAGTEVSVLEMAMSALGEIEQMSRLARPDIAVITNIGTSHMEMLGSREKIMKAKFEILAGLAEGGALILNGDEPLMLSYSPKPEGTLYVALKNRRADYYAHNIRQCGEGTEFDLTENHNKRTVRDIRIPALGNHNVYAALLAWAVGSVTGLCEDEIRRGLMKYRGAEMRQKIFELCGITIIEDCYNASPESMRAAIDVLVSLGEGGGRTVALLGDMLELGKNTEMYHKSTGAYAAECGVDILFTLGSLARFIAAGALAAGMSDENIFVNIDENTYSATAAELAGVLREGDILLVKASRAIRAERVIGCLSDILVTRSI